MDGAKKRLHGSCRLYVVSCRLLGVGYIENLLNLCFY
jgi:hypothetical protein